MPKQKSDEAKLREGYGQGMGPDYKPWLKSGRFSSKGVSSAFPDWKHGRMMEFLSQGELWFYLLFRWNDNVTDIREQFPLLPLSETNEIATELGVNPAFHGCQIKTTDMLIDFSNGSRLALSVKSSRKDVTDRQKEFLAVEQEYWKRRNVPWVLGFKEDLNPIEVRNIKDCVEMYDPTYISDEIGLIKHLIATKKITVDMTSPIDYRAVVESFKRTEVWKKETSILALC